MPREDLLEIPRNVAKTKSTIRKSGKRKAEDSESSEIKHLCFLMKYLTISDIRREHRVRLRSRLDWATDGEFLSQATKGSISKPFIQKPTVHSSAIESHSDCFICQTDLCDLQPPAKRRFGPKPNQLVLVYPLVFNDQPADNFEMVVELRGG